MIKLKPLIELKQDITFDWNKRQVNGTGINRLEKLVLKSFWGGRHPHSNVDVLDFSRGGMAFFVKIPEGSLSKRKEFESKMKKDFPFLKYEFYEEDDEYFYEISG